MSVQIRLDNQQPSFQPLRAAARVAAQDGVIQPEEHQALSQQAQADGTLTRQEKVLLSVLQEGKAEAITSLFDDSPSTTVTLAADPTPAYSSHQDLYQSRSGNPLFADYKDIGMDRLYGKATGGLFTKSSEKSLQQIQTTLGSQSPAWKSVESFLAALPQQRNDKEIVGYAHELLIDRQPPVPQGEVQALFTQLQTMLGRDYDLRAGHNRDLVASALHDIAAPSNISQHNIGTCAATCVQTQLALKSPQEYLNMLDSLAQNQAYTTPKGESISPNWTFFQEKAMRLDSERNISSMLMQNAIMDLADGGQLYNSASSVDTIRNGLNLIEAQKALETVTGQPHRMVFGSQNILATLRQSPPDLPHMSG